MYFEIENTPEHVKKARRAEAAKKNTPKEDCPRLVLAPFTKPPQVVFEDVLIGSSCEKVLEVYNPSKQIQKIALGRTLPPGLLIHLPHDRLLLEPETCYNLILEWTPVQPIALRETIHFTNENRGRYDVIVVLKSTMNLKSKAKVFKISPGKIGKKKNKKSPVSVYKKKVDTIRNTTKTSKSVMQCDSSIHYDKYKSSNKENMPSTMDYSMRGRPDKCPFDSPVNIEFNTSEIFSNIRRPQTQRVLQETYDKSYKNYCGDLNTPTAQNVLKPSNKLNTTDADMFDNLTFTPLKSLPSKNENLEKGPKIILSLNSESDFDDSINLKSTNDENATHSIICITSTQPPNKYLTVNHTQYDNQYYSETPTLVGKKVPNTSSPKELNSPNFSINTELSRISDLSFFPQRYSTERKIIQKVNCESHDLMDDMNSNVKLSSDTYTKDSPNTLMEHHNNLMFMEDKPPHYFTREQPKMCRQALFKEQQQQREYFERHYSNTRLNDHNVWQNNLRADIKSPRSLTPPLQSIPEESTYLYDTEMIDKYAKENTFTINRTFDKTHDRTTIKPTSWSKKAVKTEPDLWKVPVAHVKKTLKLRTSIPKRDLSSSLSISSRDVNETAKNISLNHIGNVYSQSFTVDPFLSATYFYEEEAVDKFEIEFKRWLNCILTPPADLDSNVDQKVDVGKAWIESRNKEIPAAPTKELVCIVYHNSRRLESLRRSARVFLLSPEMQLVFQKLYAQIDKKIIAIRTDRNLHLDVGLQKVIMELLISYNPLWLRIGLETIYGTILPMKSNSDVESLTAFIVQRMFKNPNLKNKHSKSSAPNMLLPAYMEAIKKFTLKKFFSLVFFLDQAKQKKIILHDPCLFCRNAVCKESREVIIRFTRELIAGIGDITKHLRPLGYVVTHKQSYLDEFKYSVHNLAIDIRDGVRLVKVMEIILMKNGLLNQLRAPAISRLQKIHNVQVALNALKEAGFVIVGDITAADIADGHREKTLSLLWQLIHVFRAPLFIKAANVIQAWWRKQYEVIVQKRKEEEKVRHTQNIAASKIQLWWRRIQYNRYVEWKMQQITVATIIIQKHWRKWLCQSRLRRYKKSVLKLEQWYLCKKKIRDAKEILENLRLERQELQCKSAIILQSYVRQWLCIRHYRRTRNKIILIQSLIRRFIIRNIYRKYKRSILSVQRKYRSKLLMRIEMKKLNDLRKFTIVVQSRFRMKKQRKMFLKLKSSVKVIEERRLAILRMRNERHSYLQLKQTVIKLQALCRAKKTRTDYLRQKDLILKLQYKIRAYLSMKKQRDNYLILKKATLVLQKRIRSYFLMKNTRLQYTAFRKSALVIQRYYRSYQVTKTQRNQFLNLRNAVIIIQTRYRNLLKMRKERHTFLTLKRKVLLIQVSYRSLLQMRNVKQNYQKLRAATIIVQQKYRAQMQMRKLRSQYLQLKSASITVQRAYRAYSLGKRQRQTFLKQRQAAVNIQRWFRGYQRCIQLKQQYQQMKRACKIIQTIYRSFTLGRKQRIEYIKIRTATITIQKYYRSYIEMKKVKQEYINMKVAAVVIQKFYRSHLMMKRQRNEYLLVKNAAINIQTYFRRYKESKRVRHEYCELKKTAIYLQQKYRSICAMKIEREKYLKLKAAVITMQKRYKALVAMRMQRHAYLKLFSAAVTIQKRFRANALMKLNRSQYLKTLTACICIQRFYRSFKLSQKLRSEFLKLRKSCITLQQRYRAVLVMRKAKISYLALRSACITIQRRYRAQCLMVEQSRKFSEIQKAVKTIQIHFRAYVLGKTQKKEFLALKTATILIQKKFRSVRETRRLRNEYTDMKKAVIYVQRRFRTIKIAREIKRLEATEKIQTWFRSINKRDKCRQQFLEIKRKIIIIQSTFRMHVMRKRYLEIKSATITIQRYYRSYKLAKKERQNYVIRKGSVTKLQAYVRCYLYRKRFLQIRSAALCIQAAYRLKKHRILMKERREKAALCIQKNVRRYLVQRWYRRFLHHLVLIQKMWKGKLLTRLIRCEFMQKKRTIISMQAAIRGYLMRKKIQRQKETMRKNKEERKRNRAASIIQALFRGDRVRTKIAEDKHLAEIRRRWREGALVSSQNTLKERNMEAMEVLLNFSGIDTVIKAFQSLELLTEVFPMMYNDDAATVVRSVYIYMSATNRSISSIEVLKSAAAVLVNLTKYKVTGPRIYQRDHIPPILKFMWRFSNSETQLFCILSTYLWLFSKYVDIKEDLTEFLHLPENLKILTAIKENVSRMKRMTNKSTRSKILTPQSHKHVSHMGSASNSNLMLPALDPDYGIRRADKPRYFEDAQQAINCLFQTFKL